VNHVSSQSKQFLDWAERGAESPFDGMFLTYDSVHPDGATEAELTRIFRPRPGLPFSVRRIAGKPRLVWTTFTPEQIDIDVENPVAWAYLMDVLDRLESVGVNLVRLDAVGYAIKRAGTTSFMIPETFDFIRKLGDECERRGMRVLVEIRSHHQTQIDVASQIDLVYDFALPVLVLHALHQADPQPLRNWLEMRPTNCVTVLDTHDGIGVIDVAPSGDKPGLLDAQQVDALVERIHFESGGASRKATGSAASNLDLYQVNCTFFDALGGDENAYLLARLIQVLVPGVPQIYYAGLLAAHNDINLLATTGVGRSINRPYVAERLDSMLGQPIVQKLLHLYRWRTANEALFGGEFSLLDSEPHELRIRWKQGDQALIASIDLTARSFELVISTVGSTRTVTDVSNLDVALNSSST